MQHEAVILHVVVCQMIDLTAILHGGGIKGSLGCEELVQMVRASAALSAKVQPQLMPKVC
jgi:hypothetical protein